MGLSTNEFAKRQGAAIEIASEPVRLSWNLSNLTTADSHSLIGKFSCSVRVADNPTDRRMFAEVLLCERAVVTTADLTAQFSDAISSTAFRIARTHSAEQWISGDFQREMIDALRTAAKPIAFAAGLEWLPPEQLDLSSPSLNQQRQTESMRVRAEALSAGRLEHLKHTGEMMAQFQEMRRAAPDLPAGVVLDRLAPNDRGAMLQMLLAGSAEQSEAQTLWAVGGQSLLRIDVRTTPPRLESLSLPTTLGPLRSVQSANVDGRRTLLIGARNGIMLIEPGQSTPSATYTDPLIQSELGFNRAIVWQNHIVGCHGDAGIIGWQIDRPDSAAFRIAPPSTLLPPGSSTLLNTAGRPRRPSPRNLEIVDDNHTIYSIGGSLKLLTGNLTTDLKPIDLPSQNSSEVIAILPDATALLIIREDGTIDSLDRATQSLTTALNAGGKICSAAALPWLGTARLLLATNTGPIDLLGLSDSNILRYTSSHRTLRQLAATPQHIAAVSSDRQRLILWKPWEATPFAEINISAITGHRVADVEFA